MNTDKAAPSAHPHPILLVAGLGHLDDNCSAAAVALKRFPAAELAFASKAALPDILDARAPDRGEVNLLGVGLTGNPERLEEVLRKLHKRGVRVTWFSVAFNLPASLPDSIRSLMEVRFVEAHDSLATWLAETLGIEARGITEILYSSTKSREAREWQRRLKAVEWNFTNTHDIAPIELLARDLAAERMPSQWGAETKRLLDAHAKWGNRALVTNSPAMKRLRRDIGRVAQSTVTRVLVTGENGTGKETVAQQLHVQSGRRGPFLAFNCATASRELLESRLFGYRKGAFTGATENHPGLFQEADDGTLFLDEIAELPPETQGMLLRVLQEGRVQRIGEAEERRVDVRVVAATNRDLPELVREGRFREDLYFRLSLVELHVPALRERPEDLASIAQDLWRAMTQGKKPLSDADLAALAGYDWPGNVRQLGNVLERAAIFRERGIPELVEEERRHSAALRRDSAPSHALPADSPENLDAVIRAHIQAVLDRHGGNVTEAARALGVTRNTVRARLGGV